MKSISLSLHYGIFFKVPTVILLGLFISVKSLLLSHFYETGKAPALASGYFAVGLEGVVLEHIPALECRSAVSISRLTTATDPFGRSARQSVFNISIFGTIRSKIFHILTSKVQKSLRLQLS